MYKDPRSQFGEISHQATVVIQCTQDKLDMLERMRIKNATDVDKTSYYIHGSDATLDTNTIRIDRHDLVFQVGTSRAPRGSMMNNAPPVTSNLNGIAIRRPKGENGVQLDGDVEVNHKISEGIRLMGVSLGATDPNPNDGEQMKKNQVTVRTHGSMSIFNNGPTTIVPGDTIVWTIPSKEEWAATAKRNKRFGRDMGKIPLQIMPLKSYTPGFEKVITDVFGGGLNVRIPAITSVQKFAHDIRLERAALIVDMLKGSEDVVHFFDRKHPRFQRKDQLTEAAIKFIKENILKHLNDPATIRRAVSTLRSFMAVHADIERRKVGKALSYSKAGSGVDVLLGAA